MKKLVFIVSSLLVLPAFAEVVPTYFDDEFQYNDIEYTDVEDTEYEKTQNESVKPTVRSNVSPRSSQTPRSNTNSRQPVTKRAMSSRSSSNNTPLKNTSNTLSRNVSARGATLGTNTNVSPRRATKVNNTVRSAVLTQSEPLYNPNNVVPRVSTRASAISIRNAGIRAATSSATPIVTTETITETTNEMDSLKELTEYCQAQYASCMDNYCNVLDENQGRCSCSKNIDNYAKTEAALSAATEALQDVARQIQYIGLSADDVETLFRETEAEEAMSGANDNSSLKSSLDKIKKMVIDVKSGANTSGVSTSGFSFDLSGLLDFSFDSTGFDLTSFMNTTNTTTTSSISNQRGESLYKTAVARCRTSVLNSCTSQGVDASVITNSYDLEIDKSCMAYERSLNDANKEMSNTVKNAQEVLKKARLMVAQNKNAYDLRSCVSALDSCMQDDYVCGSDYENCLDPTGKYIINGNVVVGSMPGQTINNNETETNDLTTHYSTDNIYSTWKYGSSDAWDNTPSGGNLSDYIEETVSKNASQGKGDNKRMSDYLQSKIGYHDDKTNKDYGMCMSVLNQCQKYTYDPKGKYDPENQVIKEYLQRALVQIKSEQDTVLSEYAEDCISTVSSCLSSNGYDSTSPQSSKSKVAVNSCRQQIITCMSVNGNTVGEPSPKVMQEWASGIYTDLPMYSSDTEINNYCLLNTTQGDCESVAETAYCPTKNKAIVIRCSWDEPSKTCKRNESAGSCE